MAMGTTRLDFSPSDASLPLQSQLDPPLTVMTLHNLSSPVVSRAPPAFCMCGRGTTNLSGLSFIRHQDEHTGGPVASSVRSCTFEDSPDVERTLGADAQEYLLC
jgi:hypothetical protein